MFLSQPSSATASAPKQEASPTPDPLSIQNEVCLSCHGQPGQTMPLENGETIDLTVYPEEFAASVHGQLGYACVQCHRTVGNYPHPPVSYPDAREFTIDMNKSCVTCHEPQVLLTQDSVHARALAAGNRSAAVCTDCHGSHNVERWTDEETGALLQTARLRIPEACANCHSEIYQKYRESVHGAALIDGNNTDVPTCIDCHGVHNIEDPTTATFRLASPQMCARCHTDPTVMQKYGLSTDVLDTYVADFHGTTVAVFEKQSPDAETNKPVCFDCHGIHDIKSTSDPEHGLQIKENLLVRCQACHPGANTNFPTAWLSHYIPSEDHNSLVYYVNLFYKFFIPGVLIPMAVLVIMDVGHSLIKRSRGKSEKHAAEAHETPKEPPTIPPVEPAGEPTKEVPPGPPIPDTPPEEPTKEPPSPAPDDIPPEEPVDDDKTDEEDEDD
jgi:hypothetical protein